MNVPTLVTVPPGVVMLILPVVAPPGTVAVIFVAETTVKLIADVALNLTAVAPVRKLPLIVTKAPTWALVGVNELTVGAGGITVNVAPLVATPPLVVTVSVPLVAAAGTVAVIFTAELTVNAAAAPWNATPVTPLKLLPLITTEDAALPLPGENELIDGDGNTVKLPELVPVPLGVVAAILPVEAPLGTVTVISAAETTVNVDADVPLNVTAVAPVRLLPLTVTVIPTPADVGVNELTVGGGVDVAVSRQAPRPWVTA